MSRITKEEEGGRERRHQVRWTVDVEVWDGDSGLAADGDVDVSLAWIRPVSGHRFQNRFRTRLVLGIFPIGSPICLAWASYTQVRQLRPRALQAPLA